MKEFSKEIIEIDGKEYTLFLNRKGIVAWEKYCKNENEKINQVKEKYIKLFENADSDSLEINENTNPFEGLEEIDEMEEDEKLVSNTFKKLYWIMLYTEHKLNIEEVNALYEKAKDEYGETALIELANQMLEDANMDTTERQDLKNLQALRPKKN